MSDIYIRVSPKDVSTTRNISNGLIADYDEEGELVGVEVLNGYYVTRDGKEI